jgi:hypothetical protein
LVAPVLRCTVVSVTGTSNRRSSICGLLRRHKWIPFQTAAEETYWCRRCGEQHVGKLRAEASETGDAGGAANAR